MDDNRSFETLLEGLLLPEEVFLGVFVGLEELAVKWSLALFLGCISCLILGCSLALVLEVEPDW